VSAGSLVFIWRRDRRDVAAHNLGRVPELRAGVDVRRGEPWHECTVWAELVSDEPVDRLEVALPDASVLTLDSAGDEAGSAAAVWPRRLARGDRAAWRASVVGGGGQSVRLFVTCYRGSRPWRVPIDIDLPYDIANSVH
jgi:hypothetical protein